MAQFYKVELSRVVTPRTVEQEYPEHNPDHHQVQGCPVSAHRSTALLSSCVDDGLEADWLDPKHSTFPQALGGHLKCQCLTCDSLWQMTVATPFPLSLRRQL